MLSGSQALGSIESKLREARAELEATNTRLAQISAGRADLQRREAAAYGELAKLRLDDLTERKVRRDLESAERHALSLLADHQAAVAAADKEIAAQAEAGQSLEQERQALAARNAELDERIDEAEAVTQARLAKDPAFAEQLKLAQAAEAVLRRAQRKAERAHEDRVEKGRPYEEDLLFSYLWKRGYGTARYRAFPLFRWLDGMVARLCGYAAARPNYAMLLEVPERLNGHVEMVREKSEAEAERLAGLEKAALAADGVTDQIAQLEESEAALEALDARIAGQEGEEVALRERRAGLIRGEGGSYRQALETLGQAYRQESLRRLYRDARATSTPDDDRIVEVLEDIGDQTRAVERDLTHLTAMQLAQEKRVRELDEIRASFRQQRFDSPNSIFTDPALISLVLGQFMQGGLNSRGLWDTLRRQQRFDRRRANPSFGSGGLFGGGRGFGGRAPRRTRMPRSSGGFRTGGSF